MTARKPFGAGNDAATLHGAFSRDRLEPVEASLLESILEEQPYLGLASFRSALEAYVRAEARVIVLHGWLDEHGLIGPNGEPRAASELVLRCEAQAAKARERVGLDPHSYAEIRAIASAAGFADPTFDAEEELERGRALAAELVPGLADGAYKAPEPPAAAPVQTVRPEPRAAPQEPVPPPPREEPERRPERMPPARSASSSLDDLLWRGPRRGR